MTCCAIARAPPAIADGTYRGGAFLHLNTNKRSTVLDPATVRWPRTPGRAHRSQRPDHRGHGFGRPRGVGVHVERRARAGAGPLAGAHQRVRRHGALRRLPVGRPDRASGQQQHDPWIGRTRPPSAFPVISVCALWPTWPHLARSGRCSTPSRPVSDALSTVRRPKPSRPFQPGQRPFSRIRYRDCAPGPNLYAGARESLLPLGVHPCGDGYVAMMSTPQQLDQMLEVLDDEDLYAAFARPDAFERGETKEAIDAALYPWLLSRTRAEATAEAQRVGWPLAGVNEPSEVIEADHLAQRGFWIHADDPGAGSIKLPGAPYRFAEGGWSLRRLAPRLGEHDAEVAAALQLPAAGRRRGQPARAVAAPVPSPSSPPLRGIRVLDLTTVWSGPFATMLLADLGAEVIRVENPWILPPTTKGYQARPTLSDPGFLGSLYGNPVPDRPDRPWNRHAMNNAIARNKLSCTIDNRRPEGRELLMQLVERSDVFIENFRTSGLAHIGLYTSELQARNPRLIIVRMPPTGTSGDWSDYTGFGAQFDGLTGMAWLCGHRDTELVTTPGTTYMDAASGPATAFATIAALRYRAREWPGATGRGRSEREHPEPSRRHLHRLPARRGAPAMGQSGPLARAAGVCTAAGEIEEWLAISVTDDAAWRALTEVMGRGDLGRDPRFADLTRAPGTPRRAGPAHWRVGGGPIGAPGVSRTPTGQRRRWAGPR